MAFLTLKDIINTLFTTISSFQLSVFVRGLAKIKKKFEHAYVMLIVEFMVIWTSNIRGSNGSREMLNIGAHERDARNGNCGFERGAHRAEARLAVIRLDWAPPPVVRSPIRTDNFPSRTRWKYC
jgi:hypothetical protein